jgi:hypothetical protein
MRTSRVGVSAVLLSLARCAASCVQSAEAEEASVAEQASADGGEPVTLDSMEAEQIDDAELTDSGGDACVFLCAASASTACGQISLFCRTAATITFGRSVLPCVATQIAVCASVAGLGAICSRNCPR